mgnify:CR=1 FL=1|tara:strand:+ start:59090 stop:60229 length:1140 start_codon:yes stop_codon:yes gene_type:complete
MKSTIKLLSILLSISVLCVSCATTQTHDSSTIESKTQLLKEKKPKNIILLIGDGMGLSEVSASLYYQDKPSNFERFTTIGLIKTSASSDLITDSAAGATAFASGVKTYNGAIGVDKDTTAVETIIEQLHKKNIATGIISTSSVVHATPASFYAHTKSRRMYEEIATFLPDSGIDFIAGGGLDFFNKRKDKKDFIAQLNANGYEVTTSVLPKMVSEISSETKRTKRAILLAPNGMPKMMEGRGDFLPEATKLALHDLASNQEGFFLMVEGSQIDWGGHDNDAEYLISELLDFDKTIGVALDFARENRETLVVVTADHETGGFTLGSDRGDYNNIKPTFSTDGHSATMIPVFSMGPGETLFGGVYENTEIYHKMKALFSEN